MLLVVCAIVAMLPSLVFGSRRRRQSLPTRCGVRVHGGNLVAARSVWERRTRKTFPGRRWGVEVNCSEWQLRITPAVSRHKLAADLIKRIQHPFPRGAEIGVCSMPLVVPWNVKMRYIDKSKEAHFKNCFNQTDGKSVEITYECDASTLSCVPPQTFNFLAAFHVLEHLHDPVLALGNWLRVLRPGGILLVAVPDHCSYERPRLVTRVEHFIHDRSTAITREAAEAAHTEEAAVSMLAAALVLRAKALATGKEPDYLPFPVCDWHREWQGIPSTPEWSERVERAAALHALRLAGAPDVWEWAVQRVRRMPWHQHMHVWSARSMASMLRNARHLIPVDYEVLDVHVSRASEMQMREIHLALRRLP
eukprot:Hpha_TRINITY_DN22111_c0_g1::TRINITY_DN22111_c0_g1_i1::g.103622::m.103622